MPHGLSCDCGNVQRTYKCVGVLLQNLTVDIFDCVTGPVIAGIVRLISRTPEQADMGFRFQPACARVKTHGRNAFLGEWGIVRSITTCRALLDTQVVFAKVSKQLASHHASQSLPSCYRTLNESREVGRADHVEVDIESDVPTHLLGQCAQMMAG